MVNDLPPKDRDIAMVFQNYALYPHMTVAENLGFSLRIAEGAARREIATPRSTTSRTYSAWSSCSSRRPAALSGGQRQRVAMGRAIVRAAAAYS